MCCEILDKTFQVRQKSDTISEKIDFKIQLLQIGINKQKQATK